MERIGLPFESEGIFLTNVLSHACMVLTIAQFVRWRWSFEASIGVFTWTVSFMYHLTQVFGKFFFLDELQWHWLDNVGAISSFGIWLTYMGCIRDPTIHQCMQFAFVLFAVFIQVPHPWEEEYTFGPVLAGIMIPLVTFAMRAHHASGSLLHRAQVALRVYNGREAAIGFSLLVVAVFFFALGLNDKSDPYRVFHGLWHVFAGFAALRLWRIVRTPIAAEVAQAIDRVRQQAQQQQPQATTHHAGGMPLGGASDITYLEV